MLFVCIQKTIRRIEDFNLFDTVKYFSSSAGGLITNN